MSCLVNDCIYYILQKNMNSYSLWEILALRLVSSRFRRIVSEYSMLRSMTAPTQFLVFLDGEELLGEFDDGESVILNEYTTYYVVSDKHKDTRTVWIVIACEDGYLVFRIKTEPHQSDWDYVLRKVKGEEGNKLSSIKQKFGSVQNISKQTINYPKTGFQVELQGNQRRTIKVVGKIPQTCFHKIEESVDKLDVVSQYTM